MRTRLLHGLFVVVAVNVSFVGLAAEPTPAKGVGDVAATPRADASLTPATVEEKLTRLTALCQKNQRKEVVEEFGDEDIVGWLNAFEDKKQGTSKVVNGLNLRATSFNAVGDRERARQDWEDAAKLSPSSAHMWSSLGNVYRRMGDDKKALDAYNKAFDCYRAAHTGKSYNYVSISVTLETASVLMNQTKYSEALDVLKRYDDEDIPKMSTYWACRMLRAYGQVYLATGREEEAMTKFKTALQLENKKGE